MNHPQTIARVFGVLFLITFFTSIPAYFFLELAPIGHGLREGLPSQR